MVGLVTVRMPERFLGYGDRTDYRERVTRLQRAVEALDGAEVDPFEVRPLWEPTRRDGPASDDCQTLRRLAARLTYRPGWRLEIRDDLPSRDVLVRVLAQVQDVTDPTRWLTVQSEARVFPGFVGHTSEAELVRYLYHLLRQAEDHEAREWFRLDGTAPYDPHGRERR